MYVERFQYQPISRVNAGGQRFYATPDGKRLPSVTTILDRTKTEESKQALAQWRTRVGAQRAQQITTEAANRGTRMHTYLERYIRNGVLETRPSNPFAWPSHAMAQVVIEQGLKNVSEIWGVEIPLYFPDIYAGTTDGVGVHLASETILDYKQTNPPKKREWIDDYFMQLAAYALAHNNTHETQINTGVILMCSANNEYQEFVVEDEEFEHWTNEWLKRVELYYLTN